MKKSAQILVAILAVLLFSVIPLAAQDEEPLVGTRVRPEDLPNRLDAGIQGVAVSSSRVRLSKARGPRRRATARSRVGMIEDPVQESVRVWPFTSAFSTDSFVYSMNDARR